MNAVSEMLRQFDEVTAEYNKAKLAVTDKLKPQFHAIFKDYLEAHPCIDYLRFTAYTPYFNDGDECIFGVGELDAVLVDEEYDYNEFFSSYSCNYKAAHEYLTNGAVTSGFSWSLPTPTEYFVKNYSDIIDLGLDKINEILAAKSAGQEIVGTFSAIPFDVIRDMFGDHVLVTINRAGVEVNSYDHD